MGLTPGTRIGSYEIHSHLGAGGMGEVYRARDVRLKRDVALKILPEDVSRDAERIGRFQREAELLASLNHPNIATVYDYEETADTRAIVLELVEGDTLADVIARGPLSLDDALGIARQIADALEAAHEKGVVHRDLKPANVKLTPTGQVKVLDFGLAKLLERDAQAASLTISPTLSVHATRSGVILGTAAYMSPEQARGRPVDKRTDIWAFGCVLFEMLTGRRPFDGEDVTEAIAAVVKSEPDWHALPPEVPPQIRRLLERCLAKDPRARIGDAGTVRFLTTENIMERAAASTTAPRDRHSPASERLSRAVAYALVVAASVGVTMLAVRLLNRKAGGSSPSRFAIVSPAAYPVAVQGLSPDVVIAPDGSYIVYRVFGADGQLR